MQALLSIDPTDRPSIDDVLQNHIFSGLDPHAATATTGSPADKIASTAAAIGSAGALAAGSPASKSELARKSISFMRPSAAPSARGSPPKSAVAMQRWKKAKSSMVAALRWQLVRVHLQRIIRQSRNEVWDGSAVCIPHLPHFLNMCCVYEGLITHLCV